MSHDRGCPCGREPYEYNDCENRKCTRKDMEEDTVRLEYMRYLKETGHVLDSWYCPVSYAQTKSNIETYFPRAMQIIKQVSTAHDSVRVRVISNKTNRVVDIIQ